MAKEYESKLVKAIERSASLRTTVPLPIVAVLGLEEGDAIVWTFEPGAVEVTVRKRLSAKSSKRS